MTQYGASNWRPPSHDPDHGWQMPGPKDDPVVAQTEHALEPLAAGVAEMERMIDEFFDTHVMPIHGCPNCGETLQDALTWHNVDPSEADFDPNGPEFVRCATCSHEYSL